MSYRQHPAQDVVAGARWPSRMGHGHAVVQSAAAGFVVFRFTDGKMLLPPEQMHHLNFRERFLAPYDARHVRSWFAMALANLQHFHAFMAPESTRLLARTARRSVADSFKPCRGRGGAVPPGSTYIGTYMAPLSPDSFFGDLHDALADRGADAAAA